MRYHKCHNRKKLIQLDGITQEIIGDLVKLTKSSIHVAIVSHEILDFRHFFI